MPDALVLTVNAGSTSVRLALFADTAGDPRRLALERSPAVPGREGEVLARFLAGAGAGAPVSRVAHRVVHAGSRLRHTVRFDDDVRAEVERMIPLAPLHNPPTLAWLAACGEQLPAAVPLAVFDSAFFAGLPEVAATYAVPRAVAERHGLRRLGFHGLAHRSMAEDFAALASGQRRRIISLQLGGGCSAAALLDGRPIDTSMGYSPLEGLVMATRPGDLDVGLLLHLVEREGLDLAGARRLLDEDSGLAGISGLSGDVRRLLASDQPAAALALDVYCYRARKYVGAYLAALGGADAVLIGGGAGEGAPALRARIFTGLEGLGIQLDPVRNQEARAPARISADASAIELWVMPTDEERVLAAEALAWAGQGRE
jgi:acetate kinase